MIVLAHRLRIAFIFACVSRCSSQSECEKVDGEIGYPDRCGGDDKDLCKKGYYLRISSCGCGENGSADDQCMRCEEETYMPNFNNCTSCRTKTKCKDYERESREPTLTVDRECIPNPTSSAPPTTCNCPVCECPTQSSCPPCSPPEQLTTDLSSYTSGQGISGYLTIFTTSAANATRELRYPEGNDDFWKRLAIGLGICLVVVTGLLVYSSCRKGGVCRQYIRKVKNGDCEMGIRNRQHGLGRNQRDEGGVDEDDAVNEHNEMGDRNLPIEPEIHGPDEGGVDEDDAVNEHNEIGDRNLPIEPEIHGPDEGGVDEDDPVNEHNEMGDQNLPIEPEIREPDEGHQADVALGPDSNPFPADGHLNPGKSSENIAPMSMGLATKRPGILTNEESGNSRNTSSLEPLLNSEPETNNSPSLQDAIRDTKARNGSEGLRNKGTSQPSESMEPLLSQSLQVANLDTKARNGSEGLWNKGTS